MLRLWLCGGSAGVRWCLACPSSLLDPPCDAACAVLLRAERSRPWGRVGVPPILGHRGGGIHFPGLFGTRPWRVFGVCLGWFWADLSDVWAGVLVQTNSVRDGLPSTALLLAGAAHTRAVMRIITAHLCDSMRGRGRMCRAWARTPSRGYEYLAPLGGFDDLVPLSLTEPPLACHHVGCPLMLLAIHLEFAWVHQPAICPCARKSSRNHRDG